MRLLPLVLLGGLLAASAAAQTVLYPGLQGDALLDAVRADYTPDRTLGYSLARDRLYQYEQDADGQLCGVYSGYCIQLTPGEDPSSDAFSKGINAEHTWPQSFGADNEPGRSDMHNLFPAREQVNSARGNDPFGEIPDAQTQAWYRDDVRQTAIPTAALDEWSEDRSDRFEPREDHKGNAARAVFYFYAIYPAANSSSGDAFFAGMRDDLLAWNGLDPADDKETARSDWIATQQGTPNPFVLDSTLARRAFAPSPVAAEGGPEAGLAVAVFPNPTAGRLTVEAASARDVRVEVIDALGRRVLVAVAAPGAGRLAVDLGSVPAGVYVVRVTADGATASRRVAVAR